MLFTTDKPKLSKGAVRDGLGILRFSQFFCTAVITAILPPLTTVEIWSSKTQKTELLTQKNCLKCGFSYIDGPSRGIWTPRHPAPKESNKIFSGSLQWFLAIFRWFWVLFRHLWNHAFRVLRRCLWSFMWSKTLPAPNRWLFTGPGREAFAFQVGWIVTLTEGLCKCFLRKKQGKDWGAINKENALKRRALEDDKGQLLDNWYFLLVIDNIQVIVDIVIFWCARTNASLRT